MTFGVSENSTLWNAQFPSDFAEAKIATKESGFNLLPSFVADLSAHTSFRTVVLPFCGASGRVPDGDALHRLVVRMYNVLNVGREILLQPFVNLFLQRSVIGFSKYLHLHLRLHWQRLHWALGTSTAIQDALRLTVLND